MALESENKRLKTRLAANAGDEDLFKFLWQSTSDSPSFVDDLKQRLSYVTFEQLTRDNRSHIITNLVLQKNALQHSRRPLLRCKVVVAAKQTFGVSSLKCKNNYRSTKLCTATHHRCRPTLRDCPSNCGTSRWNWRSSSCRISSGNRWASYAYMRIVMSSHRTGQAESALYGEIEKLSSAWELLDRQVKNKVFDLSALEDRMAKLNTEVSSRYKCS